jgi:FtsH-binding integral membrane protein
MSNTEPDVGYRIDPRKQFSKKLAKWTAIFWFVYMTWLSVILIIEPVAAAFSVYMGIIVTIVMLINVISYTRNSIAEKMAFTLLNKTKLELTMNGNKEEEEEGGDNG